MAEVRILLKDVGVDNLECDCSDPLVNAVLMGKASPLTELTGAQQLALIMARAARKYLADLTMQRKARHLVMPVRRH
jgi:hypothetical protein